MSEYKGVKAGGLKLKGNKQSLFKADRPKVKKAKKEAVVDEDAIAHGGWWRITDEIDLKGGINVSIEVGKEVGDGSGCYLMALDNGRFTLGPPREKGEQPNPEEMFAMIKTPDESKFSMKTGYSKYIGVDADGQLIATAEAIGTRERFQPVFQDGKSAMQAVGNSLFLSLRPDREGNIYVASRTAGDDEMINYRTDSVKAGPVDHRPDEDKKNARECETSYVKMYQHSKVDLKGRHIAVDLKDKKAVRKAQTEGDLHALLLDRRMKTKSDRYC